MWLLILAYAAVIATLLWYSMAEDDKYMLRVLCLLLWGAAIMAFVDGVMGYLLEGGELLELTSEAALLGFAMLLAALIIWEIILLIKDPRGVLRGKKGHVSASHSESTLWGRSRPLHPLSS